MDIHDFIPPFWSRAWSWRLFWALSVCLGVWLSLPLFQFHPPTHQAELTASLNFDKYATVDACVQKDHSKESCSDALKMVEQLKVSQLPLYKTTSACENYWASPCVKINTGPAELDPNGADILVTSPLVRGFGVIWDGDTPQQVTPLFQRQDSQLMPGSDDSRLQQN